MERSSHGFQDINILASVTKPSHFLHSEYLFAGLFYNVQSPWRAQNPGDKR